MMKNGLMTDSWDTDRVTYGTNEDFFTRESFAEAIGKEVRLDQVSIFFGYWCQNDECEEVPDDEQLDKHFHACPETTGGILTCPRGSCSHRGDHWQGWVYIGAF